MKKLITTVAASFIAATQAMANDEGIKSFTYGDKECIAEALREQMGSKKLSTFFGEKGHSYVRVEVASDRNTYIAFMLKNDKNGYRVAESDWKSGAFASEEIGPDERFTGKDLYNMGNHQSPIELKMGKAGNAALEALRDCKFTPAIS